MIDVAALLDSIDLADVVGRYVRLSSAGPGELEGCCPFHDERTPSFTVVPEKGFVHCFGCGAHHDAIGFMMRVASVDFVEACRRLGARDLPEASPIVKPPSLSRRDALKWVPLVPAPRDAPELFAGVECSIFNPKRGRPWRLTPARADEYRNRNGDLCGYVLRIDMPDGGKVTPQVTWCIGPDGTEQWCIRPFPRPRPICGLDALSERPGAPVLAVEGEKCRAAGAGALPQFVVITWPGGANGVSHTDWSPLEGRDVVLWPDADPPGYDAMLGHVDYKGAVHRGVAQHANHVGCRSLRMVDPRGQPLGWDIFDALHIDMWTPRQLAAWARSRVVGVDVVADHRRPVV